MFAKFGPLGALFLAWGTTFGCQNHSRGTDQNWSEGPILETAIISPGGPIWGGTDFGGTGQSEGRDRGVSHHSNF